MGGERIDDVVEHPLLRGGADAIEMARSTLYAAGARCETVEGGAVYLEARALHPLRSLIPDWFVRINEIIKTLGGHNLIQVSSQAQLADPRIRGLVEEFMPGANGASAEDRSNLFRAAWDFTGSELGADASCTNATTCRRLGPTARSRNGCTPPRPRRAARSSCRS